MSSYRLRVSEDGSIVLPADVRARWSLDAGGAVEIADLGTSLVVVPAAHGGLRALLRTAIDEAGGCAALVAARERERLIDRAFAEGSARRPEDDADLEVARRLAAETIDDETWEPWW